MKRPQRKLKPFPRQTSCSNRTKILKATRLLQKSEYTLTLFKTLIQLHYYSMTDSSQASITEESYSRGFDGGKVNTKSKQKVHFEGNKLELRKLEYLN